MLLGILTDKEFELLVKMLTHDLEKLVTITSRLLNRLLAGSMTLENPKHRSLLESSVYAIDRSRRIIADLNEIMTTRQLSVSVQPCFLPDVIKRVADSFALVAENEGLRFSSECRGPGRVTTDSDLLIRIVENFLYNAISYTDAGGWIHLKVETEKNGEYEVSVENSGPMIPEEDLERIFNVTVRLDSKRTWFRRGSGLGLAFCRMAADALEAQVGARNLNENKSIVFYCRN